MTESTFAVETFSMDSMSPSPGAEIPRLTVSPADTTLKFEDVVPEGLPKVDTPKPAEKKPVKKRKSWGQELPTPKTNLPPRYVSCHYILLFFYVFIGQIAITNLMQKTSKNGR